MTVKGDSMQCVDGPGKFCENKSSVFLRKLASNFFELEARHPDTARGSHPSRIGSCVHSVSLSGLQSAMGHGCVAILWRVQMSRVSFGKTEAHNQHTLGC